MKDEREDLEVTLLGAAVGAKWWYEKEVQTLYIETLEVVDKPRVSVYRIYVRVKGRPQGLDLNTWYGDFVRSPYCMVLLIVLLVAFSTTRNIIAGSLRYTYWGEGKVELTQIYLLPLFIW